VGIAWEGRRANAASGEAETRLALAANGIGGAPGKTRTSSPQIRSTLRKRHGLPRLAVYRTGFKHIRTGSSASPPSTSPTIIVVGRRYPRGKSGGYSRGGPATRRYQGMKYAIAGGATVFTFAQNIPSRRVCLRVLPTARKCSKNKLFKTRLSVLVSGRFRRETKNGRTVSAYWPSACSHRFREPQCGKPLRSAHVQAGSVGQVLIRPDGNTLQRQHMANLKHDHRPTAGTRQLFPICASCASRPSRRVAHSSPTPTQLRDTAPILFK
jgi:hypothetical protein